MGIYPYAQPLGGFEQVIRHMRKTPQKEMNASKLKALGIAPNNESYIINTLRALGLFDEKGKEVAEKTKIFYGDDDEFSSGLSKLVQETYSGLFAIHSDAWTIDKPKLMSFFRGTDKSSELTGGRQADTFIKLAELSGKRPQTGATKTYSSKKIITKSKKPKEEKMIESDKQTIVTQQQQINANGIALTVRVEINLPHDGTKEEYDAIFKSIRENLMN
jgi:hypothetical protein